METDRGLFDLNMPGERVEVPFSDVPGIERMLDNIPDPAPDPSELVGSFRSHRFLDEQVEEVLNALTPREREILQRRFGLVNGKSDTLEQVAAEFGTTPDEIKEEEASALLKLRHPSRLKKLKDYLAD